MASEFIETLETALTNIVTLDIVTLVGDVDLAISDVAQMKGAAMRTQINLVDGTIVTQIDPRFLDGGTLSYSSLRPYHEAQAKQGRAIIDSNITTLESLFKLAENRIGGGGTSGD